MREQAHGEARRAETARTKTVAAPVGQRGEESVLVAVIDRDRLRDGVAYADRWVEYQQGLKDTPGVVVAVALGEELLLSKGYGFADLERRTRMAPTHIFRIASHSKTFTATAIMQLVEGGRLRLDDPLGVSIPWLPGRLAGVTIRQALSHAAGIVRDGDDCDFWQLEQPFPDAAELRRLVERSGDVLPANERFKYSNLGYALLGLVVEAAGGVPYQEYVRRHVIERLGLRDTGPETDDWARLRLATGYTRPRFGLPRRAVLDVATGALAPATGFYATAEDLCRYAAAHCLGNDALLSDAAKREMQQPYWAIEQSEGRYGLGFETTIVGERRLVGHGGGFPGHATRTQFDPTDRLVVVVLTNESGGPARAFADTVVKIIDFALGKPALPAERSAEYARFAGRFVNAFGVLDVAHFGDALVALNPEEDDPVKHVTELRV
ncbi:MAG TPA: serine hydrolase domain-containing protein, partial [Chloroflexota bacterium]|nr:serine hydrolase domain-containing protein [Chloroflexota bacterium]